MAFAESQQSRRKRLEKSVRSGAVIERINTLERERTQRELDKGRMSMNSSIGGRRYVSGTSYRNGRRSTSTPNPSMSFEQLFDNHNEHLELFGDFEKGDPGYKYLKKVYERNPERYLEDGERGDRYRERANIIATKHKWDYPEKRAAYRAQRKAQGLSAG